MFFVQADVKSEKIKQCSKANFSLELLPFLVAPEKFSEQMFVQALSFQNVNPNECNRNGVTPLMLALANKLPVVKILLDAGADPTKQAKDGVSALMLAAGFHNDVSVTEMLLDAGADVNAKDNKGRTPLMYAARKNSLDVVRKLLQGGADIAAKDNVGRGLLYYINQNEVLKNNPEARFLLSGQTDQVSERSQMKYANLLAAAKDGKIEDVEQFITAGANVNMLSQNGWTPLMLAAGYNAPEIVKILLKSGADVHVKDPRGWTPLMAAARMSSSTEIVKILVAAGSDLSAKTSRGNTVLGLLMQNENLRDNPELRALFIPREGQPRIKYANLLAAAKDGKIKDVEQFITAGANVNMLSQNGWTPLMFAAGYNTPEIVKILLKSGADVHVKDPRGWTPLMAAARMSSFEEVLKILIDAGSELNAKTSKGNTALTLLSQNERLKDNAETRALLSQK